MSFYNAAAPIVRAGIAQRAEQALTALRLLGAAVQLEFDRVDRDRVLVAAVAR